MHLFDEMAATIGEAERVSLKWQGKGTGWMPFNLFDFGGLLLECYTWAPNKRLLEIGCGPGPNLMLARAMGWDACGIEINEAMAQAARETGLDVLTRDAFEFTGYDAYGAIWFNRAERDDRRKETLLEQKVLGEMADGAVLICANLEKPPPSSWWIISDQWDDLRRGAWAKPTKPGATPAG